MPVDVMFVDVDYYKYIVLSPVAAGLVVVVDDIPLGSIQESCNALQGINFQFAIVTYRWEDVRHSQTKAQKVYEFPLLCSIQTFRYVALM